jgi:hypothetical protein
VKSGVSRSGCVGQVPGIKFCWWGKTTNVNYADEAEGLLARLIIWGKRVKL